jgi:hypothetical protein
VAQGGAAPGLLAHRGRHAGLDRLDCQQLPFGAVAGGIEGGHVDPLHLGQPPQPLGPRGVAAGLQGVEEGGQQQLAIAEQHGVEEGGERLGVGGEHRSAAEHDRIVVAPLGRPEGDALPLQQIEQYGSIELPAEGEPEQIEARSPAAAAAMGRVSAIGEQPPHGQIGAPGQGGPDHLKAQAGDAHRVGAGEGQYHPQRPGFRHGGLEQQGFLIQGRAGAWSFILEGPGHT